MHTILSPAIRVLVFLPALTLLLWACDSEIGRTPTPEEAVKERAQGWMDALLKGDLLGAYNFTSPNYRQFASAGTYHARVGGAGGWDTGTVDAVECEPQVCTVRYMVEYEIRRMGGVKNRRPLEYKWVELEGEWWLYVPAK